MSRRKLPNDCAAVRHKVTINAPAGPCEGYIHLGLYPELPRRLGEIFIRLDRETKRRYPGLDGVVDDWTIATSMALQYGCEIDVIVDKHTHSQGIAHGSTQNPAIPTTTGLIAYATEYLRQRLCGPESERVPLYGGKVIAEAPAASRVDVATHEPKPFAEVAYSHTVIGPLAGHKQEDKPFPAGPADRDEPAAEACPNCGKPLPFAATSCPACGAGVEECSACGGMKLRGCSSCPWCSAAPGT